ncbi:thiamine-binding protein [Nakamurella sp. YIM 132087]|uniref:Thiamine-binding protein n=1 Tax=Nakamurella alba TaxID=2665158 RepID=A0A7K1FF21_9ACTN|nr:thiamine-binding protein [Nakamurella alba]MTD12680.1 thiamine-binding protein [Nakamurella alba]
MLIAFSVAPSGTGELSPVDPAGGSGDGSVSAAVAAAVQVVRESGLPHRTDSMFTTLEGEWDECMAVIKQACEVVGRYGSRVSLVLKADIRPGRTGEIDGKVARVERLLGS